MELQHQEGQAKVIAHVIDAGICVRCGACVGICPYFDCFNGKIVVMERCYAEPSRCAQICPRIAYEPTSPIKNDGAGGEIGEYLKVVMARSSDPGIRNASQYGGTVSTLCAHALEKGFIESAILTDRGENSRVPGGCVAKDQTEVLSCAGSRYAASGSLSEMNRAVGAGQKNLGVIGLPCQMDAIARMERAEPKESLMAESVVLKIGLFCTWALDSEQLAAFLKEKGVVGPVRKFDIPPPPADEFSVETEKGWEVFPLSEVRPLIQKGCAFCQDMTAELADIAVGTVEGREDWNTVLVRTDAGLSLMESAIADGSLEIDELPMDHLNHLKAAAKGKRQRGKQAGARSS